MVLVKLLLHHSELSGFEGGDRDAAPRLGAAYIRFKTVRSPKSLDSGAILETEPSEGQQ